MGLTICSSTNQNLSLSRLEHNQRCVPDQIEVPFPFLNERRSPNVLLEEMAISIALLIEIGSILNTCRRWFEFHIFRLQRLDLFLLFGDFTYLLQPTG